MLRARIRAGEALIGTYVTFPSPEIVEVLAAVGMDYAIVDLQHSSPDWQTIAHMIRAADARGIAPLVRTYNHDPALILKLLDMGAEGLLIPGVRNAAEVAALASAFYYAPVGRRGACGHTRVGAYNPRRGEFPQHVQRQNERVFIWALIEDPDSIGNATEIAAVRPGASVISVGRGDLSVLLGHAGQIDHPEVVATAEQIYREVGEASGGNCACAAMIQTLADVRPWYDRGVRLFTYNADAVVLARAMGEAVDGFRAALSAR